MHIDWSAFTPWSALAGGLLIGGAAVAFALLVGRIAGISGIVGGLVRPLRGDIAWRIAFVAGLLAAPLLFLLFGRSPEVRIESSTPTLVIAGLLVGLGSRLGSGCTSGHGVCGLARRSSRSLVATLVFMGAGFVTVFIARHVL
ncbi:MAG: YeeE/YedE family protein [Usitatibacter sp.]